MYNIEFIKVDTLPFEIKKNQILYLSNKENKTFENFFFDKKSVQSLLKNKEQSFELIFIPDLINQLQQKFSSLPELVNYSLPFIKSGKELHNLSNEIKIEDFSSMFFSSIDYYEAIVPGFILKKNNNTLIYLKLECTSESEIKQILINIHQILKSDDFEWYKRSEIRFKCDTEPPLGEEYADYMFDSQAQKITNDIISKIDSIDKPEIIHYLIKVLSKKLSESKKEEYLSRLRITRNGQIFLIDYNQVEVLLTPLQKAVFFLFLKHTEGILFTALHFYRSEVISLYKELTTREHWDNVIKSIEDLTDSTNNSINEKCSRIKSAFVKIMGDDFAKYYYVTGGRGEPKKIILPRNLVEWEKEF